MAQIYLPLTLDKEYLWSKSITDAQPTVKFYLLTSDDTPAGVRICWAALFKVT